MKRLINVDEAKALVIGTQGRKDKVIELMNAYIREQAKNGKKWAHFPPEIEANEIERSWLTDELRIAGFTVVDEHPRVRW